MFIALEGGDGCGKTTLCKALSEKMGAIAYATPPKKYLQMRGAVDKNSSNQEHYQFYRDGIYDASDEIKVLTQGGSTVISDRYWLSTYTYHQVMGVSVSQKDFLSIIQPTLTVILSLTHEVQIVRMMNRGLSVGDRRMLDTQNEIAQAFYRNALEFNIPFLVLDTQKFSPTACVDIILASIK